MTCVRWNSRQGVRLEFRPEAGIPWCVVDLAAGVVLAAFLDKRSAVTEYLDTCSGLRKHAMRRLPFWRPAVAR